MADIQINISRFTEVHKDLERARAKLASVKPSLAVDVSHSEALAAFKQRVDDLASLVDLYAARVEADSQRIYQIALSLMDQDDALAKTYAAKIGSSLDER